MNQHGHEGDATSMCDSLSVLEPQGHTNKVYYLLWTKCDVPPGLRGWFVKLLTGFNSKLVKTAAFELHLFLWI